MRIAIIGGIGSGKSAVLEIVRKLGFAVCSADEINKELLSDKQYLRLLGAAFPDVVVDGKVDKDSLREQIFNDRAKRLMLNNIAHPFIKKRVATIVENPLFVEVPLIVESGMACEFDEIILVRSKKSRRLKRLKERKNMEGIARKVVRAQLSDKKLMPYSTVIINNNGSIEELEQVVQEVVNCLFGDAKTKAIQVEQL